MKIIEQQRLLTYFTITETEEKINFPILVLWGKKGTIEKLYDPIKIWKNWATNVTGFSLNCGHFLPEEKPRDTLKAILNFFL